MSITMPICDSHIWCHIVVQMNTAHISTLFDGCRVWYISTKTWNYLFYISYSFHHSNFISFYTQILFSFCRTKMAANHVNGVDCSDKVAILDAGAQYGKVTSLYSTSMLRAILVKVVRGMVGLMIFFLRHPPIIWIHWTPHSFNYFQTLPLKTTLGKW